MSFEGAAGEQAARLAQLGQRFEELAGLLMSAQSGPPDPDRVVRFAARAVPHSQHAGVTLIRAKRRPESLATTGEVPLRVDAIQYDTGEGPCLEAVKGHDVVRVNDLAQDSPWPVFAERCVTETGIRAMFSLRLSLSGQERAALNFYAEPPGSFEDLDIGIGAMFAPFAALAVGTSLQESELKDLRVALQTSRGIGVAIGILMARQLVTYDGAFAQLVNASQHLNRKLRDIAAEVTLTGQLPELPRKPRRQTHDT